MAADAVGGHALARAAALTWPGDTVRGVAGITRGGVVVGLLGGVALGSLGLSLRVATAVPTAEAWSEACERAGFGPAPPARMHQQLEHDLVVQSFVLLGLGTAAGLGAVTGVKRIRDKWQPLFLLAALTSPLGVLAGLVVAAVSPLGRRISRADDEA